MNFKERTLIFLKSYDNEILEEGINNNSASKRLKKIIDRAERKASEKGVSETLVTLRKEYQDFLRLENAYKSASSTERKELKKEYKELQNKYSHQLKRIHVPKGAIAAAIITAALAVTGMKYSINQDRLQYSKEMELAKNYTQTLANAIETSSQEKDQIWEKRKASQEEENRLFRKTEEKNKKYFEKYNVMGYAKKLYNGGIISPKNRKSLESDSFYYYKNALMKSCLVDGYMTEERGKEFAKEYLRHLELKSPMDYQNIIRMARRYIASSKLYSYDKMMTKAGRWQMADTKF